MDGRVSASDAIAVLQSLPSGSSSPFYPGTNFRVYDVSSTVNDLLGNPRDNTIAPVDALRIINFLGSTKYHQNPNNRFDVNADGHVAPIDCLNVLNYLNLDGNEAPPISNIAEPFFVGSDSNFFLYPFSLVYQLKPDAQPTTAKFLDVTGDNKVTSADAYAVLYQLY